MLNAQIAALIVFTFQCYTGETINHTVNQYCYIVRARKTTKSHHCNVSSFLFQNYSIMLEIYNTKWYKQTITFRKQMVLFMASCQKPFRIRAFGSFEINLGNYASFIKNTYSYLQFILNIYKWVLDYWINLVFYARARAPTEMSDRFVVTFSVDRSSVLKLGYFLWGSIESGRFEICTIHMYQVTSPVISRSSIHPSSWPAYVEMAFHYGY